VTVEQVGVVPFFVPFLEADRSLSSLSALVVLDPRPLFLASTFVVMV